MDRRVVALIALTPFAACGVALAQDDQANAAAESAAQAGAVQPEGAAPAEPQPLEETEEAEGADWSGLVERAPAFFAKFHHAAVHLPIALWLFGGFFVLIGLFKPSLRTQVPLACLIGGAVTAVAATATGWWYAAHDWGTPWTWDEGFGDWSEHLVKHRWVGVALVAGSLVLSVLAIVGQAKKNRTLGVVWRVGLLVLAAAVSWEGHLGGELIQGEGFLEEAYEEWVNPDGE